MRFLLKSAFMIFLLLLAVPFFAPLLLDEPRLENQSTLPSSRDIGGAISAAKGTIEYMGGMCADRPEVCDDGAGILSFLGKRARQGAKIVYLYLGQHFSKEDGSSTKNNMATSSPPAAITQYAKQKQEPKDLTLTGAIPQPLISTSVLSRPKQSEPLAPAHISDLPENVPLPTPRPH